MTPRQRPVRSARPTPSATSCRTGTATALSAPRAAACKRSVAVPRAASIAACWAPTSFTACAGCWPQASAHARPGMGQTAASRSPPSEPGDFVPRYAMQIISVWRLRAPRPDRLLGNLSKDSYGYQESPGYRRSDRDHPSGRPPVDRQRQRWNAVRDYFRRERQLHADQVG